MSDDLTGVDPARMARAASALENLRNVLAANVPKIMTIMNSYGSPVSLSLLAQAQARSVADAAAMRARSDLAQKLSQSEGLSMIPGVSMVTIAWNGSAVDAASALADARLLQSAEQDRNSQQALADIQAVADDVSDHLAQGDLAYLSDFYNHAGPAVAGLATVLHNLNGSAREPMPALLANAFSQQDREILNSFATGLAHVDSSGMLQPPAIRQLTATSTLWSMGMLVKYGPSGSAWNTADPGKSSQNFLSQLTLAEFHAYQDGTLRIPLGPGKFPIPAQDYQQVEQALSQYDPLSALLQADAQNTTAAMQVLASPDGSKISSFLLNGGGFRYSLQNTDPPSQYFTILGPDEAPKGEFPTVYLSGLDQQAIGSFLDAATSAPRGDDAAAWQSAWAAYNIISNTPAPLIEGGSVAWQVSAPVRAALMDTFARYVPDLAFAAGGVERDPVGGQRPYVIGVTSTQLNAYLQEISLDKNDFIQMQAMASMATGSSVGVLARGGSVPALPGPVTAFAALYARISAEAANVGITMAQQEDLHNQMLNQMISIAEEGVWFVPGAAEGVLFVKALDAADKVASVTPIAFSTNNEAKAVANANTQQGMNELLAEVPLIRGLMATGALPDPPPPDAFDASGNPTDALGEWWSYHGNEVVGGKPLWEWVSFIQGAMGVQQNAFGGS